MIIDCHGHYTTAPEAHTDWRQAQKAAFATGVAPPPYPGISDDDIRASIDGGQLKLMTERAVDGRYSRRVPRPWSTTSATRRSACAGPR